MAGKSKSIAGGKRPKRFDRNLIVIGGGAAGLVSAYMAAASKAKVTLIEAGEMGGDCLNTGCVPSKALIQSAKLAHRMRNAETFGVASVKPEVDFSAVMARVDQVIADIAPHDSAERYTDLGVEVLSGWAKLTDPWTVEIALTDGSTQTLTARSIIIATGAAPVMPDLPGLDEVDPLTTETVWEAMRGRAEPPKRLAVLGGGPIGVELAQAFQRLGSAVTLIEMVPHLLMREDHDVSDYVRMALERDGVEVLTGHIAKRCATGHSEKWIELEHEDEKRRVVFDDLLIAVGRAPRVAGFGLEELELMQNARIETNAYLQSLHPDIYLAGDVAGKYQFTHSAAHEAWFASMNALFGRVKRFKVDYRVIPAATFCDPEVARVGLTEREAQAQGIDYDVTRYGIDDLDRAIADGSAEGWVTVITPKGKDRILGAAIVGSHAADLIAEFALAMRHGLGLGKILSTVHIYPTLAEANKYAAGEWRRGHLNPYLLKLAERFHAWRRG